MWWPGKFIKTILKTRKASESGGISISGTGYVYFDVFYDGEETDYNLRVVVNGQDITSQLRRIIEIEVPVAATVVEHKLNITEGWLGKYGFSLEYKIKGSITVKDEYSEDYEEYISKITIIG